MLARQHNSNLMMCGAAGAGPTAAAAEPSQTEEQRLKEQKRAAKAHRKQQWQAQQAALAQEDADADGAAEPLNGATDDDDAAEPAEPDSAPKNKSRKATRDVVRGQCDVSSASEMCIA